MLLTSTAFRAKLLDTANRVIRTKINVYDTKMAVKSKGIPFNYYKETGLVPSFSDRQLPSNSSDNYCVLPNLSLSWSYGSPFYIDVPYFSFDTGDAYFRAEENSSSFGIYVLGHGVTTDLWLGGGQRITLQPVTHSPSRYASYGTLLSTAGSWTQFRFRFYGC